MTLYKGNSETASDIMKGYPLVLRADFENQNPLPSIMRIHFNGELLCSSPRGKKFSF
jgi:hypothetical protein